MPTTQSPAQPHQAGADPITRCHRLLQWAAEDLNDPTIQADPERLELERKTVVKRLGPHIEEIVHLIRRQLQQDQPAPDQHLANQANQALLDSIRRLSAGEHLVGDQVCIVIACFSIDVLATGFAPDSELVRVYVHTDNPDTFSLQIFAAYLGIAQPLVEGAMQFVTVLKHGQQPLPVLPLVPSHADGLNLLCHGDAPNIETSILTPPIPGQYWPAQGGWYAGIQRSDDGTSGWHLILPQGDQYTLHDVAWGERGQDIKGADHQFDGMANTLAMADAGNELAQRIRALPGDCYLPSRFESALLYATVREQIDTGDWYWTSTQYSSYRAWLQYFGTDSQGSYSKSASVRAVAVRRLALESFNSLDAA